VDFLGVRRRVDLDLLEKCEVGDYVIVHAGFAIGKLDQEDALETIEYFKQIAEYSQ
jgi:hydrogenase expression/formation protein HypC